MPWALGILAVLLMLSTGVLRRPVAVPRGVSISPVVVRPASISSAQTLACVQFELFSYLIIYQFK